MRARPTTYTAYDAEIAPDEHTDEHTDEHGYTLRQIKKAAYDLGCGYTAERDPEIRRIKEALFNLGAGYAG